MNRINTLDETLCCGCLACEATCPKKAISMVENEKGFIMPQIDEAKCVNCGLCVRVCDFKKTHNADSNMRKAFSIVIKDKAILKNSTSGGAFTAFSDVILADSGYVVGAVMEDDFTIHHIAVCDKNGRDRMRGSKYVQSNTYDIFGQVEKLLINGKKVLFTGTPCQCAALKSYLGRDDDNLVVLDFLCHGVPNNKMFKEHIEYLNSYYKIPSIGFSFRNKTYGWDSYNNNNNLSNGKTKTRWINQIFYNFFISNLSLRPACHHCPYRSLHRPSDITIADFWGIEKLTQRKNCEGVSLVLTHTEKGKRMMKRIDESCEVVEYPFEKVAYRIALLPSKPNLKSDAFWKTYQEEGYIGIARKYFSNSFKNRVRFEVRKIAKKLGIG